MAKFHLPSRNCWTNSRREESSSTIPKPRIGVRRMPTRCNEVVIGRGQNYGGAQEHDWFLTQFGRQAMTLLKVPVALLTAVFVICGSPSKHGFN
jgi:hypothetical protein